MNKSKLALAVIAMWGMLFTSSCKKDDAVPAGTNTGASATANSTHTLVGLFNMGDYTASSNLQLLDSTLNVASNINTGSAVMNFQKWNINGAIRYTYQLYDPNAKSIAGVGYIPGSAVLLDENLKEIKRFRLLPYGSRTTADIDALDGHDFILLDDNHYIAMAYYQKAVSNIDSSLHPAAGCTVVAPIIQEVQNGNVVWEWDATDYPEFYANSVEGNDYTNATNAQDYMHMNSMFIDPKDNNLVCSFRNQNQIVKINRKTGNIIWRLGGKNSDFPMTADQKFLRQHDATINNEGHIMMMDNGDATERPYSRVVELAIDESAKTISSFKSLQLPYSLFCQYMGSVQKTSNTYFIGCGSVPRILEINFNNGSVVADKTLSSVSYRALRY